ncbi:RnfH family protein [Hylemonella sp. W303a]|uniref:RnfH family protein n=1 Tax=Hylemonella sp. W303a TaxID=3389873 RepID=UPI00396B01F2
MPQSQGPTQGLAQDHVQPPTTITVVVAHAHAPRKVREQLLSLPIGATVAQAVAACDWPEFPAHDLAALATSGVLGLWGRKTTPEQVLREGDRVELYRPLRVDPKVARRERFASQGSKRAGLFAQRRAGAKAGY